jgi:hypothetical protein
VPDIVDQQADEQKNAGDDAGKDQYQYTRRRPLIQFVQEKIGKPK